MLKFNVINQSLLRLDKTNPVTDSVEYLQAQFTFSTDDWSGKIKTAIFTKGTSTYTVLLDSKGVCNVPFEVLQSNKSSKVLGNTNKISVSLVGTYNTVRITTNEVKINLNYSGYAEGQEPSEPTAGMYEQILTAYADAEAKCEEATNECVEAKNKLDSVGNIFANAIKGKVSGEIVAIHDASSVEHDLILKIRSRNLFPNMEVGKTATMAGVTFTYNDDGSVSLKGTATTSSNFGVGDVYLDEDKYYVCDFAIGQIPDNYQARTQVYSETTGKSIATLNNFKSAAYGGADSVLKKGWYQCRIRIDGGFAYDCTLYPTLLKNEIPTNYIKYISDLSNSTVRSFGKNLFKVEPRTINGVTLSKVNNYYVLNGTATESNNFVVSIGKLPKGTYTLSANNISNNGLDWSLIDVYSVSPYSILSVNDNVNNGKNTVELAESNEYLCRIRIEKGVTYNHFIIKPQLEYNNVPTDYEEYIEKTIYNSLESGIVEGIKSKTPNMTLITDKTSTIIECQYNKDINIVLNKITDALSIEI